MADNNKKMKYSKKSGSQGPRNSGPNKPSSKFHPIYLLYGVVIVIFLAANFFVPGGEPIETNWYKVKQEMLKNKDISRIEVVNGKKANIYLKDTSYKKYQAEFSGWNAPSELGPQFFFLIGSTDKFEENLEEAQNELQVKESDWVPFSYIEHHNYLGEIIQWIMPFLLILLIWWWFFKRMSKGNGGSGGSGNIFNVGKSQAKVFDKGSRVNVNFKQVAGLSEAKQEIEEIVEFLKSPERYTKLGGKIPKGALLVGPPGTGKTLLAKAVAGEADVPFFSMSGSDFVEMFVGVGASRVRDLFKQAKEKSPCIVFIDEIDAIGRARGKNAGFSSNDERENTLNQLLTEMDGFDTNSGVIILAATNRADILDKALMRAGRFDRQIHVELPDINEREAIFQVHLKALKLEEGLNLDFLAKQTPGFSGADIANVCNEAALYAARKKKENVGRQDFLDAIDRIIGGLEKKNKIISPQEKKAIAYHEAGHAAVSWLLEHAHPLVKVTIVPRGKALGAAWYLPEERQITTKNQMIDEMCATLGGRAAEELIFGEISSGAQNDLEKVTRQAYAMVCYFGMSDKVGNLSFYDSTGQRDSAFYRPYSEQTAQMIDQEIRDLVDQAYERTKQILRDNKDGHEKLAELLLEREVIFTEDVERIFGPRPGQTKTESIEETLKDKNSEEPENTPPPLN